MRRVILVLALALAAPALRGQQAGTATPPSGTIEGTVMNGSTGEPLKKATVTVRRVLTGGEARLIRRSGMRADLAQGAVTDSAGRFAFSNLQPGDYNIWAYRPDFVSEAYRGRHARGGYENVHLGPGATISDIHFKLLPGAVIAGKVVDEDGDPVIGANVQAMRYNWFNGERQLSPFGNANTNDLGEYRIYGLVPGAYYVRAFDPNQAEASGEVYAPAYYPQGRDPSGATPIEVKPADEADGTDLTLLPVRAVCVRGQVMSAAGAAQGGSFSVTLMPKGDLTNQYPFHSTQVSANGGFEIYNVTPGSYILFAMWFPGAGRRGFRAYDRREQFTGRTAVDVGDADVNGVTIGVGPGVAITGKVQTAPGMLLPAGLQVVLEPREQPMIGTPPATVNADGTFEFASVPDGVYRARLNGSLGQNVYVKSATLGGADALDSDVAISNDDSPGALVVTLDPHGGQVEGVVMNGEKPFTAATVVLVPNAPHRSQSRLYSVATTDNSGHFAMESVPPGDYKLFAWDAVDGDAYLDPAFLAPYESQGKDVHVDPNGTANVQAEVLVTEGNSE